ncbi:MAG: molybdopterin-dependent oxidoreductase [Thermoleophilia bacterium]|nr:molybdopterin-dependent oxidoreductase [Thermoleophilia bacterium]
MAEIRRLTNCTTGGPVFVDVKDDRIVRITPIEFDDSDAPSWTIEARGNKYSPPRKALVSPWTVAQRSTIYSPKRILTPLKRVDFDVSGAPGSTGPRGRNIQNRGVSGYEPIPWDEALDIVAGEMLRVRRECGPCGMLAEPSSHHLWGNVGYRFSAYYRFMNLVGFTHGEHNPDSWEAWLWGGAHMWGNTYRLGAVEQYGLLQDALENTEMVVFWSSDPDTTAGVYGGYESTPRRFWLQDLGVKMVFIDPFYNHTNALMRGKWLAPRPGTDVPVALAIAFTWLTEGTYDKEYIDGRTTDFDVWKAYVLGDSDGQPKTPEWAETESGVPAREIRALAREWASKKTMLAAGGLPGTGGAARAATGNEWCRSMIALAAMQGMGKPGSNMWSTVQGPPLDPSFDFAGYTEGGISGDLANSAAGRGFAFKMFPEGGVTVNPHHSAEGQLVYRLRIPEALQHERFSWHGRGFTGSHIEAQFCKYEYPAPGYPMIGMYYRYGGSFIGTMTETNRYVNSYRKGKVPFVVNQSVWMEGEAKFADIILPACTNFERWDIGEWTNAAGYVPDSFMQLNHRVIVFQKKCIEPLGESKPDYDIFAELAKRLDVWGPFTMGGRTDLDWVKQYFHATDLAKVMTWEEFEDKGYYVVPAAKGRQPVAMRWFAEDRERDTPDWGPAPWEQVHNRGLQTQSGKIEFVASSLKRLEASGYIDPERPVMGPTYMPSWEGHHTTELTAKYPLQLISPHPRYSFHTMGDSKDSWTREIKDNRVLKEDGRYYWIMRVNSKDAHARGIQDGELLRAFNDRGSVIFAAAVTERMAPGVVHAYESCADYDPVGVPGESPDRAGCVNILTPSRFITPMSSGMANNSCLVQIEKWEGQPE